MQVILADEETLQPGAAALEEELSDLIADMGPGRRRSFLCGRALILAGLRAAGRDDPLPPIRIGEHGKPYFEGEFKVFHFNLSHSRGIYALATGHFPQGLDLELIKPRHDLQGLAERELSPSELAIFNAADDNGKADCFTRAWTVREALIKASGLGLAGIGAIKADAGAGTVEALDNEPGTVASFRLPRGWPAGFLSYFLREGALAVHTRLLPGGQLEELKLESVGSYAVNPRAD